jgi:hypothetical protein
VVVTVVVTVVPVVVDVVMVVAVNNAVEFVWWWRCWRRCELGVLVVVVLCNGGWLLMIEPPRYFVFSPSQFLILLFGYHQIGSPHLWRQVQRHRNRLPVRVSSKPSPSRQRARVANGFWFRRHANASGQANSEIEILNLVVVVGGVIFRLGLLFRPSSVTSGITVVT